MGPSGTAIGRCTRAVVLVVVAAITVPLWSSPAEAAPGSAAAAAKIVADAAQQLTQLDEKVQQLQLQVAKQQKLASDATARANAAQAAVDAYDPQLRAIAYSGATGGSQSRIAAFLTSHSAADLVQQMTTLDMIATHTEAVIGQVAVAADAARAAKAAADQEAAKASADLAALQQQQQDMQTRIASYRADYARLSDNERTAVTAAIAGPTLTAKTSAVVAGAPSAAAATILRTALAQLGKPYVYGSPGPDSFDCSGLTSFAYAAAGILLPHSSAAQSTMGKPVARADLKPGDIVYFYTPVSHVAIYIGNGMMIEARTFGQPVSITSVDRAGYRGARDLLGGP